MPTQPIEEDRLDIAYAALYGPEALEEHEVKNQEPEKPPPQIKDTFVEYKPPTLEREYTD